MRIYHFSTSSGREPVKEFIESLPSDTRYELLALLRRLEAGEMLTLPHARSMASMLHGLHELRVSDSQGIVRVFYYTKLKDGIFLIHGLRKKSRIIPEKERNLILKRVKELNSRERR